MRNFVVLLISLFFLQNMSFSQTTLQGSISVDDLKTLKNQNKIHVTKNSKYTPQIRSAIKKYKMKNYVGCLQDLQWVSKKEPYNPIVSYYLAIAYSRLGYIEKAKEAYNRATILDPNSLVGKYSKTGLSCLNDPTSCVSKTEITELDKFIKSDKPFAPEVQRDLNKRKIEQQRRLINNEINKSELPVQESKLSFNKGFIKNKSEREISDGTNIAQQIDNKKIVANKNVQTSDVNCCDGGGVGRYNSYPTNDEIAQAVKVLQRMGLNPLSFLNQQQNNVIPVNQYQLNSDLMQLNAMLGNTMNNGLTNSNNLFNNMLPYLMQNSQNPNFKMTPQMIQTMLTSSMMSNLDFNLDNKK